jgi:ribosome biogenesis GTPase
MSERRRKKGPREKDLTSRYLSGHLDEDRIDASQRFTDRSKHAEQNKILKTAAMRAGNVSGEEIDTLPVGEVVQVYSLFADVEHEGVIHLCVVRKTLNRVAESGIVVGDRVRFRVTGSVDESGRPEGVVEQVLPRRTVLTRADSFKAREQHPIVANAEQMLIVVSLVHPRVKWGLVDRMLIAAQAGGLVPLLCLNKIDLAQTDAEGRKAIGPADEALAHYDSMGIASLRTSVELEMGIDTLRDRLRDRVTVLAGHSGVGKSSLIRAVQPSLDLRVGIVSTITQKGRHTTTSARRYVLDVGGAVIDTPGVKLFGLWGVSSENVGDYFPDVQAGTAPAWRVESFERIKASVG